jgi:MFS family permease
VIAHLRPGPIAGAKRPLIILLAANALSLTGDNLTLLAVPWFVLVTTGSVARTGVAAVASTLPIMLSAGVAGALADRIGLCRASVLSDLASGLIVITIPALYLTTGLPFWTLLALLFTRWFLATPGDTARQAMIPDLTTRGQVSLARATAAYDSIYRGAQMTGPALAGVLILWIGPAPLLFIDGTTFLASALLVGLGVPRLTHTTTSSLAPRRYLADLREGLDFLWHERLLRAAVAVIVVTNMLDMGMIQVLLPAYGRQTEHNPAASGLLLAAVGAGALAGTFAYGALGARLPRKTTFAVAFLIAGAPRPLVLAAGAPFGVALAITALSGFAAGAINPLFGVLQFERIPSHLRARVIGAITAGAYAGMPVGGLLAGFLTDAAGLPATLAIFACIFLLVSIPPFTGRAWKQENFTAPPPDIPAQDTGPGESGEGPLDKAAHRV